MSLHTIFPPARRAELGRPTPPAPPQSRPHRAARPVFAPRSARPRRASSFDLAARDPRRSRRLSGGARPRTNRRRSIPFARESVKYAVRPSSTIECRTTSSGRGPTRAIAAVPRGSKSWTFVAGRSAGCARVAGVASCTPRRVLASSRAGTRARATAGWPCLTVTLAHRIPILILMYL